MRTASRLTCLRSGRRDLRLIFMPRTDVGAVHLTTKKTPLRLRHDGFERRRPVVNVFSAGRDREAGGGEAERRVRRRPFANKLNPAGQPCSRSIRGNSDTSRDKLRRRHATDVTMPEKVLSSCAASVSAFACRHRHELIVDTLMEPRTPTWRVDSCSMTTS